MFGEDTKDWVTTRDEDTNLTAYLGNVTRFNSLSRNGRIFIDQLARVVPFRPDENFPHSHLGNLTWSLHGSNVGVSNKLTLRARTVKSASGKIKRLLVSDCNPIQVND